MTYTFPTFPNIVTGPAFEASGLTGAVAGTRLVGATTSGVPVSGTFEVGDFIVDQTGAIWVCTIEGTPGTWAAVGGATEVGVWLFSVETVPMNETMTLYYRGTFPGDSGGAGWPSISGFWRNTVQVGPFTFPASGDILVSPYFEADVPVPASPALNAGEGPTITISSLDGSQTGVLQPTGFSGVLIPTGDSTGSVDTWTYTTGVGSDIAWDGTNLTTTAGGAFWFILSFALEFGD